MAKKINRQAVDTLLGKIERQKEVMAKERDKLRGLYDDLSEIVESWGSGIDSIESGLREMQDGLDRFSERL